MKRERNQTPKSSYWKNNQGMSLVTVIIVIGFIAVLVSTLLMVSLMNLKMKRVNAYATDSFYSAEQVLDEINIGLQKDISDALSSSYSEILTNYADYDTQQKNTLLKTKYYEHLWDELGYYNTNFYYSTDILYDYLKDTTKWRGSDEEGYGAILRTTNQADTAIGQMITYEDTGIVLKGLIVYYKDAKGFISTIQTDIRLAYPDFDFAASTALPDVPKYSFIADGGFLFDRPGGGTLTLTGNAYADSASITATDTASKAQLLQNGMSQFIVKHDLELTNSSFTNEKKGEIWAENIVAAGSNVTLLGNSNLSDDLNIKGNGTTITLAGIYNGFGNSLTDSTKSSAILVNGTNAVLDLSKLSRITLAGHAYVGSNSKNVGTPGGTAEVEGNQIYTGESLAVKSNQLMYLIPSQCLWVSKETGKSVYGENPIALTAKEYNELLAADDLTEVSLDVTAVGEENLSSYIKQVGGVAQPERVFIPTSDPNTTLVYYYMKFASEDAANNYFMKYYHANKDTVDAYVSFYAKEIKFPNTQSLLRLRLAGNYLTGSKEEGYIGNATLYTDASEKFSGNTQSDDQTFRALTTKLIKNYSEMTNLTKEPSETEQIVFENIVDETALDEFIDRFGTGNICTVTDHVEGAETNAVLTKGSYTISDSKVHLVIAKGDVVVAVPDFKGMIIANGTVSVGAAVQTMTADEDLTKAVLRFAKDDGTQIYLVGSVLKDGADLMYSSLNHGEEKASVSLASLVVYENWTKE